MAQESYTQLLPPEFFYVEGGCQDVLHDLSVEKGDLANSGFEAVSAILIQMGTDASFNGNRGWWGEQFLGFTLGSLIWTLTNNVKTDNNNTNQTRADEYVRESMEVLIRQGFFDNVVLRTVTTVGGFELILDATKNGVSIFSAEVA